MRKILRWAMLLTTLLTLTGCAGKESAQPKWEEPLYRTVVYNSGEDESNETYLEIAQRSQKLLAALEEKAGAFVMDAYNYQTVDDKGTPLYTMNNPEVPIEIAPNGMSVRVSREYFKWNPIETADGSELAVQIVQDDLTLNLLVPEQYRDLEQEILAAWREYFYFEKVEAGNYYNETEQMDISEDQLTINIIYVKDGQRYFTYRSDCASSDGSWITDPLVQIYTGNIHCSYAHSFLTQWTYIPSESGSPEKAYEEISPYILECGAQERLKELRPLRNK